jgi:hypothetical protein
MKKALIVLLLLFACFGCKAQNIYADIFFSVPLNMGCALIDSIPENAVQGNYYVTCICLDSHSTLNRNLQITTTVNWNLYECVVIDSLTTNYNPYFSQTNSFTLTDSLGASVSSIFLRGLYYAEDSGTTSTGKTIKANFR